MKIYRGIKAIKAISFDLDDTLYDNQPVIRRLEQKMLVWLEQQFPKTEALSPQDWKRLKHQVVVIEPSLCHNVTLWRQKQIELGLKQAGYSDLQAEKGSVKGIDKAMELRNDIEVPEQTHMVMQLLKAKLPLIAITNGNVDPNAIGLEKYFHSVLKAGIDGNAKPDGKMFQVAARRLGLKPEEILHVGDHLTTDVHGAKQAGYLACWINLTGNHLGAQKSVPTLPDIEISDLKQLLYLI